MGKTYHYWKHRVIQLAIHVVFLWGTPEQDVLTEKTNKWYFNIEHGRFFLRLYLNNSFLTIINVQDSTCRVEKALVDMVPVYACSLCNLPALQSYKYHSLVKLPVIGEGLYQLVQQLINKPEKLQ